ncbi:5-dehydro-2-deoxygluconokinase [Anaerolentibacter hominis]|uniref:5-dehydro-2-deoxygluconokinase n=1 Tax=Anaerolentibacter hominis TaxID=3079009 RepID=UPI0031B85E37
MGNHIVFDETRPLDIIPVGRITVDLNPSRENYYKSTADVTYFMKYLGGSPGNIAVGTKRLGRKVGFIGKLSPDQFGDYIDGYFKEEGIDRTCLTRAPKGYNTGLTFTEILSKTESSIMMYREHVADLQLSTDDIDEEYIKSAKAILLSGTALCQSPSREAILKALAIAKRTNTVVIFDIDYRPHIWKNEDEIAVYYSIVAKDADIIIGSREEFSLTEKFLLPGNEDDKVSAEYWFNQGAKAVIIKHGKEGSDAYFSNGESYRAKPFPVELVKSFGGGDGYASAFLWGMFEGLPYKNCLSLGSACAAMLVASESCANDMPTIDKLQAFEKEAIEKYGDMVTPL